MSDRVDPSGSSGTARPHERDRFTDQDERTLVLTDAFRSDGGACPGPDGPRDGLELLVLTPDRKIAAAAARSAPEFTDDMQDRAGTRASEPMRLNPENRCLPERTARAGLADKIAYLEMAVSRTPENWDPEGTGGKRLGVAGMNRSTSSERSIEALDPRIDPKAFHALLEEIVRSEVNQALHEQMRANLRKLVQNEIHRALITSKPD